MPELKVFSLDGEAIETVEFLSTTAASPRAMHQTMVAFQSGRRHGTHKTKGRGELRGGGRKPYRQKGTGRARHGSRREPQSRGGGTVHGPQPHRHLQSVIRKVGRQAFADALGFHAAHGTLQLLEVPESFDGKTQTLIQFLIRQELMGRTVLLVAHPSEGALLRAGRNVEGVRAQHPVQTGLTDLLGASAVVCTRGAWEELNRRQSR